MFCIFLFIHLYRDVFGTCLQEAGDYELQATIMEAIFRLISPEDKEKFASYWFSSKSVQNLFLSIRNEEFETVSKLYSLFKHFFELLRN